MVTDYYEEAMLIAQCLKREGFTSEASRLIEAIENGSTSGEILGALRWNLERIETAKAIEDLVLQKRIHSLMMSIDAALQA